MFGVKFQKKRYPIENKQYSVEKLSVAGRNRNTIESNNFTAGYFFVCQSSVFRRL